MSSSSSTNTKTITAEQVHNALDTKFAEDSVDDMTSKLYRHYHDQIGDHIKNRNQARKDARILDTKTNLQIEHQFRTSLRKTLTDITMDDANNYICSREISFDRKYLTVEDAWAGILADMAPELVADMDAFTLALNPVFPDTSSWLDKKGSTAVVGDVIKPIKYMEAILGDCQLGKSGMEFARAILTLHKGGVPLVLVRNLENELKGLTKSFTRFIDNASTLFELNNLVFNRIKIETCQNASSLKHLQADLCRKKGKTNTIYIAMTNVTQIKHLSGLVCKRPLVLISDEVDATYCHAKTAGVYPVIQSLREIASAEFLVTATIHDTIALEEDLMVSSFVKMKHTLEYRGFSSVEQKILPRPTFFFSSDATFAEVCTKDENIMDTLRWLNMCRSTKRLDCEDAVVKNPQHMLFNLTNRVSTVGNIAKGIASAFPNITVFSQTGEGITVSKDLPGWKAGVKRSKVFHQDVYQLIASTYPDSPVASIVISHLASRCTSFISSGGHFQLSDIYMVVPDCTRASELVQMAGRIFGNNLHSGVKTSIHAHLDLLKDLSKSFYTPKQIITAAMKNEDTLTMRSAVELVPINCDKILKKRPFHNPAVIKSGKKLRLDVIKGDDGMGVFDYSSSPEKKSSGSYVDDGGVKFIDPKLMGNTSVQKKVYDMVVKVLLDEFETGVWISRSSVVKELIKAGEPGNDCDYYYGNISRMIETKSRSCMSTSDGLKVRKTQGSWSLRFE
jgi:hypothetical protein